MLSLQFKFMHQPGQKVRWCVVLLVVLLTSLSIATTAYSTAKPSITVGIFDFEPICFLDKNKEPAGIYVDLLNNIARQENWNIRYKFNTWHQHLADLKSGKLDLLVSVASTPERRATLDFSTEPVLTLWGEIFTRPDLQIETILDLQDRYVAIMKGDVTGENFRQTAKAFNINCTFVEVATLTEIMTAIDSHKVEAGVIPSFYGLTHHGEFHVKKTAIMFNPFSIYFATPKGENKNILATIDTYMQEWRQNNNSYYNSRLNFWISNDQYTKRHIPRWVILSGATLLILAILFAVWIKLLRVQVVSQNTDLKQSKDRYQAIFNSISDAIVIHDADTGSIVDINETMLSMVGCTREEALHSLNILTQGEPPYSATEASQYLQKAAQGIDQLFEWKICRTDGSKFWCEVALKANVINDQKIIIAVARDIEERKLHEDQLRHAHRMEAIGTLAGGIAHDFNNILTGIFGYTELAKLNPEQPEKIDEYLTEIQISAKRAKKLITQIQTFSKKHPIQKQPLQLSKVTEEVLKLLSSSIPSTINVVADLESTTLVHADPTQLHQVILNLCTNSSHAMENTTGTLTVSLKDVQFRTAKIIDNHPLPAGHYVLLSIQDTGHGIGPEIIKQIFDPYFTTKEQGKGTGLGLAVVQGIIDSHGGNIIVRSQPGQGTIFNIYLPALQKQQEDDLPETSAKEKLIGGNETILMVDDEPAIIKAISTILEEFGYTVHPFTNPKQALAAFKQHPRQYDLVLTDMTMPELPGADLAHHILQERADIPIIIATGNTDIISPENAAEIGIKAYCAKPISLPTLLKTVREALDT